MTTAFGRLDLSGRCAVVTGSSGGIGKASSLLLAERGADVVGVDLSAGSTTQVEADLATEEGCRSVAEHCSREGLRPSILVNNAGVGVFAAGVHEADLSVWDRVMAVNARSVYCLTREFLPSLRSSPDAVVVNVSSVHAMATSLGVGAYAASKGAVVALTRSMALDLAQFGIRVVALLPGAIDTPMMREHVAREGRPMEELGFTMDPLVPGRVCAPSEVAEVIAFLASPAASGITGSTVTVDGGLLAGFS
jgi:NAD(P)-dependent dehydrogenase (short-subunit alcohol dehydrogenase family)